MERLRQEILVIVGRCRRLERICQGLLMVTEAGGFGAPLASGHEEVSDNDPDGEATTERCPETKPWAGQ
jgi:hypothetical protein